MVSKNKRKNIKKNKKIKKRTKKRKNKCELNLEKAIIKILKDYENCLNKKNKRKKNKNKKDEGGVIFPTDNINNDIDAMNFMDTVRVNNLDATQNEITNTYLNIPEATELYNLQNVNHILEKEDEGEIIVPFANYLDKNVEYNNNYSNSDDINKNKEIKKKTQKICAYTYCNKKFKVNEQYTIGICGCLYHLDCFNKVYRKEGKISIYCFNCDVNNEFKTKPWKDRTKQCKKCNKSFENDSFGKPQCNVMCVFCNSYLKWISYEDCNPIKRKNLNGISKIYRYGSINQKMKKKIRTKIKTLRKKIGEKIKTMKEKAKTMRKKSNRVRPIFRNETNNNNND